MNQESTSQRKQDHIELAFISQTTENDKRFYYEPAITTMPEENLKFPEFSLGGKQNKVPFWISSMTGGTKQASNINKRLANACRIFGMGMGLGSCRIILDDDTYFEDFNLRPILGDAVPFFANLGIAQIEQLFKNNKQNQIIDLVQKLNTDGLIVHINPLQEWLQPEGDRYTWTPIETIKKLIDISNFPIIVKEVGQGFGPKSIESILQLPIEALDFGAHGGTNFARLELERSSEISKQALSPLAQIGHTPIEMIEFVNRFINSHSETIQCKKVIVSGGIRNFLDGYYYTGIINCDAIYGQASAMLKMALIGQDELNEYCNAQILGLKAAYKFLTIKRLN